MSRKKPSQTDPVERNTEIALFRYGLIATLLYEPQETGVTEKALRAIAARSYTIPHSKRTQVSVTSLRRYLQAYQKGGFEALRPQERGDKRTPRAFSAEVLAKAVALREEQPARTTPMIVQLLRRDPEVKPDDIPNAHTLATHLRQLGKTRRLLKQQDRAFKRFERSLPNELWQGDAMDGPWLPDPTQPAKKRKAYLFCFLDDYSRLVPYAEFFWDEALPRMERVLKVGMLRRGVPKAIYVDNGRVYTANQFAAACATLGIQRIHTKPYCPEGKGKQERFFETVRLQFMPEVAVSSIASLDELNQSFWAWLELIYHQTVHSETGQAPLERYQQAVQNVRPADHNQLIQAFRWRETRKVRKDGRIELQGNSYQVDASFIGRMLELRFDPFDLSTLELWFDGCSIGQATVTIQNRQRHIQVERLATQPPPTPKSAASLDYLALLRQEYDEFQRQAAGKLQFTKLHKQDN
ncbi:MAG: integrase [Chloroflexi bacterium]|nr:MAG: integrase [Chloroflexota bacterium]RPH63565.1 MAG: integrase [Chloroflexota bacterium]